MSQSIPIPATVDELRAAIESIFEPLGKSERAYDFVGQQRADMYTFLCGKTVPEGYSRDSMDYYFPTEESAIQATWNELQKLRYDASYKVTREEMEDGMPFRFLPSRVIWRSYPEVVSTPNGIFTVRLRAAFI